MFAPLSLTIPIFLLSIIGLYGNIKFILMNRKEANLHKRLLLFLVAIQTPLCFTMFIDVLRDYCGIPLTRQSCLRFVGAIYACLVVAMSIFYCCMGVEMIALVARPLLFSRLKAWWFHIPVYIGSLLHIYPVYMSWISPENHGVTLCFSPMAISPDQRVYGKTLLWVCSIIMFIEDMIFLVYLLAKKSMLKNSFTTRQLLPSFAIVNIHLFFWIISTLIIMFSAELSAVSGISPLNLLNFTQLTSAVTFGQTYYAYFFANSQNRRAFLKRGPIALFQPASESSVNQIQPSNSISTRNSISLATSRPQLRN